MYLHGNYRNSSFDCRRRWLNYSIINYFHFQTKNSFLIFIYFYSIFHFSFLYFPVLINNPCVLYKYRIIFNISKDTFSNKNCYPEFSKKIRSFSEFSKDQLKGLSIVFFVSLINIKKLHSFLHHKNIDWKLFL